MANVSKVFFSAVMAMGFVGMAAVSTQALAETTAKEKAQEVGNDAKATGKKAGHRVEEAVCNEGDAKCAAKKVGHRANEAGTAVSNKTKEMKDKAN